MNGKKTGLLRIVKFTALLLPVVMFLLLLPVNNYEDTPRIQHYYLEEEDSLDVVILGSSENYAGFSPVLAYEEYGFTSYPYVLSANDFSLFQEQLEEALRFQSPELVIVDIGELIQVGRSNKDTVLRQFAAGIPFSREKVQMIREHGDGEHQLSYYLPFFINHGNMTPKTIWSYLRLNHAIQSRGYSLLKGTVTFTGYGDNWDGPYVTPRNTVNDYSVAELSPEVIAQCDAVLESCGKHPQIRFLFINTPHRITTEEGYWNFQRVNAAGAYLEENGYDFLNLECLTDRIGIVPEEDFYNNSHLNLYGQYKVTRFLCDILTEEYGVRGRNLSPENQAQWDTCVEYSKLYFQLFEEDHKIRNSENFGLWLQEDNWLLEKLEERKLAAD